MAEDGTADSIRRGGAGEGAIAVIGLACRLPGAPTPEDLWELLRSGRDAIGEPSERRLRAEPRLAGHRGGFLEHVDEFDAGFFGVSPREAAAMDPQQRLVLELAWEALEDAMLPPGDLAGVHAGVFLGAMSSDYATLVHRHGDEAITRHSLAGLNRGILANRISYCLGLRGPSLTVDTAQSSALVAVHLACESLRSGESAVALAGGVNLNLAPESTVTADRFGGLSPDGRCFTFDARANGYVRGEGGGLVVLKPLSRALADGDNVYAVITGSAVNNDGATSGLTVPDAAAQEEVVRLAVRRAGVERAAVQVVESHGTGTKVGDPIEAAALGAALGTARPAEQPLIVGSAKTNVGHLEGAAGIVGLLKTVLSIRHREVPPSLNFETPNPQIDFAALNLKVADQLRPWPRPDATLVAGVSSFGVGGVNCHVVLSEPPVADGLTEVPADGPAGDTADATADATATAPETPPAVPLVLSARTAAALREQAGRLYGSAALDGDLSDVAFSLATTRATLEHRAVLVGKDRRELRDQLLAFSVGDHVPGVVHGAMRRDVGRTVFVFPGQGSQWLGMGRDLAKASPLFARHLIAVADALAPHTGWSPVDVLWSLPGAPSLDRVDVVQPALFAVMVALARLWESYGIRPDAVMGHSQGEIAAAHVAGALSLEDAAAIVVLRSQAIAAISGRGGMASIPLPVAQVRTRLTRWAGRLNIGAVNGPSATVVSGDADALDELVAEYLAEDVSARRVRIDYASHSPHVEAVREQLLERLPRYVPRSTGTAFYSSVTGGLLDTAELDAGYWYRNLRQTVEFDRAVHAALSDGHNVFVETSPHPILVVGLRQILESAAPDIPAARDGVVAGTLRRDNGDLGQFLRALAQLHVHGSPVDWRYAVRPGARRVPLPTYAFQRSRHWLGTPATTPATTPETTVRPDIATPGTTGHGIAQHETGQHETGGALEPGNALAARISGLTGEAQEKVVLDLVVSATAGVLGHADAASVAPDHTFKDLGLDSLGVVELRDSLSAATGLPVSPTVTFDHPTPLALARHLRATSAGRTAEPTATAVAHTGAAPENEPIALVAMAGRWPGGADTPEKLWRLVLGGTDAISVFPANRGWDVEGLYDPDAVRPGTSTTREGGFLHDADRFDAEFFGIGPREAAAMDPQQRLLLEVAWETFERAGIVPESLKGSRTGVFVGMMPQDYGPRLHETAEGAEGYALTGTLTSVASGRIAYTFGLEGPAVTVDTACSSSLVALHLAVRSLRSGESDLALAGGVTVMSTPGMFTEFSRQGGLAPDGRCKAFGAAADGTGWAEGVGLLLVERLSDARRHGHRVLAVIRGSAVNQDGASNGLTAPNGLSQQRVIREALKDAALSAAEVDAVEAHGTGTTLGDPIEAQALLATYGQGRPAGHPLWLGSLKSNIGHAQAAAGIAGVIKMVQAIHHGILPQTLHVEEPTPHIDWSDGAISLLAGNTPWPETGSVRRAGVSSFGISGTNAHVIVEQAPPEPEPELHTESEPGEPQGGEQSSQEAEAAAERQSRQQPQAGPGQQPQAGPEQRLPVAPGQRLPVVPWVISGRSRAALHAQAERLAAHLDTHPTLNPVDVGYSLATTRTHFEHRAVIIAETRQDLTDETRALASPTAPAGTTSRAVSGAAAGVVTGTAGANPAVAFLFTGQGSQRTGMGRQLYDTFPLYAHTFDTVTDHLDHHLTHLARQDDQPAPASVRDVVFGTTDPHLIDQTLYTQPALFALQISLYRLIESWGITPTTVTGHSAGALAAAHIAGILDLNNATTLVATRAHLMSTLPTGGTIIAIQATEQEITHALIPGATIAAINTPTSTVISGDTTPVQQVAQHFRDQGRKTRQLPVSHAFHSHRMDPILNAFHTALTHITFHPPTIGFISDHTGQPATTQQLTSPDYWTNHLRHPIRFHDALQTAHNDGITAYLEIGPDAVLTALAQEALSSDTITAIPALRGDRPEVATALTAAAHLHTRGTPVDWAAVYTDSDPTTVDLPTYAFQQRRHWLDHPKPSAAAAGNGESDEAHARFWDTVSRGDLDSLVETLGAGDEGVRESLGAVLPALASWHAARGTRSTIDSWRYRLSWRPVTTETPARLAGRWLLVRPAHSEAAEWAKVLAHAFEERGAEAASIVIDAGTADRDALIEALGSVSPDEPVTGVLSLLSFDDTPHAAHPAVSRGNAAEVALIQALGVAGISGPLWIATSGTVSATPSDQLSHPGRALAWGLGGVVAAERPEGWGGLLDLPARPDARAAAHAVTALAGDHGESELAVRAAGLLARRLVPAPLLDGSAVPSPWASPGTVLITGGTGALGGHVARRLARRGVRHLLLIGRRGLDAPGAAELEAELTGLGARVTIAACDVSDRDALAATLAAIPPEHPLSAVIHTAAVLDDSLLDSLTTERMHRAQRVKVGGALNLHELTRDLDLSAFVLFSSIAGTIGTAGQGNYAPGNAFLDAFAEHRRSIGLPATSIAWGQWDGDGIAGDGAKQQLRRNGLRPMDPDLAVTALEEVLDHGETRLIVSRADWTAVLATRPHPLLAELPEAREAALSGPAAASEAGGDDGPDLVRRLSTLPEAERRQTVRRVVRTEIAAVLGHSSAADVDDQRGFRDQGFSSLSAVELRNRLSRLTGTALPSSLVFDYPTPAELVDHLHAVLVPEPEPPLAAMLAKIDELESLLSVASLPPLDRDAATARLRRLLDTPPPGEAVPGGMPGGVPGGHPASGDLSSASDDELISFISNELGIS